MVGKFAVSVRKALDLEAPIRSEVIGRVDKLPGIERDPDQAIVKTRGRHWLDDDRVASAIPRLRDHRRTRIAGHDQDRQGAKFAFLVPANRAGEIAA